MSEKAPDGNIQDQHHSHDNDTPEIVNENVTSDEEKIIEDKTHDDPPKNPNDCRLTTRCYIPRRYMVSCLSAIGMMLVYAMRTNIGLTAITLLDPESISKVGTEDAQASIPVETWNTREVGLLHAIFYVGFLLSHPFGGYLSTVRHCSRLFGGCILLSGALNLALPYCIEKTHIALPYTIRILQGLSEGFLYPACYGVLRHWSTPNERGRLVSAVMTGCYAGAIVGFPTAGLITHYIGWQFVFYVSGGLCILWYLLWLCLVSEKPSHDSTISDEEYEFLETSKGDSAIDYQDLKIPWKEIFTSLPVWMITLCHFTRCWILTLMLTNEPYFLNNYGFDLAENGIYCAIPFILKVVLSFLSGFIADFLLNKTQCSTTSVRKLLTATGFVGQAIFLVFLTLFNDDSVTVLILLTFSVGFFGLSISGWQVNHYDLATRYAGVLVSITSGIGTLGSILVPIVTAEILYRHKSDARGWNDVFYITIGILITVTVLYVFLGSGEEQSWAHPPEHIKLVQKTDPLARKPYVLKPQQSDTPPMFAIDAQDSKFKTTILSNEESPQTRLVHRLNIK